MTTGQDSTTLDGHSELGRLGEMRYTEYASMAYDPVTSWLDAPTTTTMPVDVVDIDITLTARQIDASSSYALLSSSALDVYDPRSSSRVSMPRQAEPRRRTTRRLE